MAKKINYAELSNDDLKNRVNDLSAEMSAAKQKLRMGSFKKISEFTRLRRDIARSLTELRARELGIAGASPVATGEASTAVVAAATKKTATKKKTVKKAKASPKKPAARKKK